LVITTTTLKLEQMNSFITLIDEHAVDMKDCNLLMMGRKKIIESSYECVNINLLDEAESFLS
jgi:hypothetical protein